MAKTTAGGRQSSNKSGVRSLGKKMDNSRYGFQSQPASHQKPGAFAQESRLDGRPDESGDEHDTRGEGGGAAPRERFIA